MLSVRGFFTIVFTPLARRMAGVDPNRLTLVSLVAGVLAGAAFALAGRGALWYVAGGIGVAISGAADSLDGLVARLHARATPGGDFFDHVADRIIEVSILAGIAVSPATTPLFGVSVIALTLLHSGLGAQIVASFGRRGYEGGGKAEQFVGLLIFAAVLAVNPDGAVTMGGRQISLGNVFFAILGLATLLAFLHRLQRGVRFALSGTHATGEALEP